MIGLIRSAVQLLNIAVRVAGVVVRTVVHGGWIMRTLAAVAALVVWYGVSAPAPLDAESGRQVDVPSDATLSARVSAWAATCGVKVDRSHMAVMHRTGLAAPVMAWHGRLDDLGAIWLPEADGWHVLDDRCPKDPPADGVRLAPAVADAERLMAAIDGLVEQCAVATDVDVVPVDVGTVVVSVDSDPQRSIEFNLDGEGWRHAGGGCAAAAQ